MPEIRAPISRDDVIASNGGERQRVKIETHREATNREVTNREVKWQLCVLYDEVFAHTGYGDLRVEVRRLRHDQKEVILHCGKQYRYVVNYSTPAPDNKRTLPDMGRRSGVERRQQSASRNFKLERRKGSDRRGLVNLD